MMLLQEQHMTAPRLASSRQSRLFIKKQANLHQKVNLCCYEQWQPLQQNPASRISCLFDFLVTQYNPTKLQAIYLALIWYN